MNLVLFLIMQVRLIKFLSDPKVAGVFKYFKNNNLQGKHLCTLKIIHGMVVLEFHPSGTCTPRPLHLLSNYDSIEGHLDQMIIILKKLNADSLS